MVHIKVDCGGMDSAKQTRIVMAVEIFSKDRGLQIQTLGKGARSQEFAIAERKLETFGETRIAYNVG
jgi:hypothetical protein